MMFSTPTIVIVTLRYVEKWAVSVCGSRVLLEMVIYAFEKGQTPEDIVQSFSSLKLDDVYAVISYYLQNRDEVNQYMAQVEADSEAIRAKIEASQPNMSDIRERLLKRYTENQKR